MTTISIIGLYNYDNTIFDPITLPTGMTKSILTNNILMECGTLETFLPDPTIMKNAIKYWSDAHKEVWQHLYDTTQYVYNPIWNKDGTYTETETRNLYKSDNDTETRNLTGSDSSTETRNLYSSDHSTETRNLAGSEDSTETHNLAATDDSTTTNSTNAYNGSGFTGRDQTILDKDTSDTGTIDIEKDTTDTGTIGRVGSNTESGTVGVNRNTTDTGTVGRVHSATDTGTVKITRTEQGNIGVTTTQEMIKQEREIAEFNLYAYITQSFKERFCIMVY